MQKGRSACEREIQGSAEAAERERAEVVTLFILFKLLVSFLPLKGCRECR